MKNEVIEVLNKEELTFPRIMMVSNEPIDDKNKGVKRVVFMHKLNRYLAWEGSDTFEKAEKTWLTIACRHAKELPKEAIITKHDLMLKEIELKKILGINETIQIKIEL